MIGDFRKKLLVHKSDLLLLSVCVYYKDYSVEFIKNSFSTAWKAIERKNKYSVALYFFAPCAEYQF